VFARVLVLPVLLFVSAPFLAAQSVPDADTAWPGSTSPHVLERHSDRWSPNASRAQRAGEPVLLEVRPPLLMLSPAGPTQGQLGLFLVDGDGVPLNPGDFTVTWDRVNGNPAVGSVDANGLVTIGSTPAEDLDAPYFFATVDGTATTNASVLIGTESDLGVTHQYFEGSHVTLYVPPTLDGVDLASLTTGFGVVSAADLSYRALNIGVGTLPFGGGRQYVVLDVSDDPDVVPCGLSGNPTRLGWVFGSLPENNCYIYNDSDEATEPSPRFYFLSHMLGHNFVRSEVSQPFDEFFDAVPNRTFDWTEAVSDLGSFFTDWATDSCFAGFNDDRSADFDEVIAQRRDSLALYQTAGSSWNAADWRVLSGVFLDLFDDYGAESWYDFFSVFLPGDAALACGVTTDAQQATLVAAAFSASAGTDLRDRFETDYGFPIADGAWNSLLTCAQTRIAQRTFDEEAICTAMGLIFQDGFEAGNTSAWGRSVGLP
jgi:hypothetical protein